MFKLSKDKKSFIPFLMAGVPDLQATKEAILFLSQLDVAAIELGVPFTDPIADGPVNQEAAMIGLTHQVTLEMIFSLLFELQALEIKTPIILFTYLNPLLSLGVKQFIARAKAVNLQALLVVDLPVEEGEEFYQVLREAEISPVLLVSPTTRIERYQAMKALEPAFIYYISRCAVTGMNHLLRDTLSDEVSTLRGYFPEQAIAVGFGISNAAHAEAVSVYADGVVVGSALMTHLNQGDMASFKALASDIQHCFARD